MNDREFINEVRRGLTIIMRAMIKRFCMSWTDFLPAENRPAPASPEPAASGAGQSGV